MGGAYGSGLCSQRPNKNLKLPWKLYLFVFTLLYVVTYYIKWVKISWKFSMIE